MPSMNMDWGAPPPRDVAHDYQDAFRLGRHVAGGEDTTEADPRAGIVDASAEQARQAARAAEMLAGVLHGIALATPDPRRRLSMAQHIAQQNPQFGIHPDSLTLDDVSDRGLQAHINAVLSTKARLETQARAGESVAPTPRHDIRPGPTLGRHISNDDLKIALGL